MDPGDHPHREGELKMRSLVQFRRAIVAGTMVLSTLLVVGLATPARAQVPSSISSNFNGTAITAGDYIWFSSVLSYSGPTTSPVTISVRNATIQFAANSTPYTLSVPDADVTFSPTAVTAMTTFNTVANRWETTTPFSLPGNEFLSALAYQVPVDFPGGTNPVVWSGQFSSSGGAFCINWKWAAAVYATFSSDNNALGVKPVDSNSASVYLNSDHAGTPESFKAFVIGGARGGGGSNYTGSLSGTVAVCDLPLPARPSTWGALKAGYR